MTDDSFRTMAGEAAKTISEVGPIDPAKWDEFASNLYYSPGDYSGSESHAQLANGWRSSTRRKNLGATVCSTFPRRRKFIQTSSSISAARDWRVPPIPDRGCASLLKSRLAATWPPRKELNKIVLNVFEEKQVYRIDHYLGKDTVQNLLVLRFGNGIFEPLWNRNYVDHVQITASETLGVERRGGFYETAGALRDMIQSHVLQLTSLVAVEPPASFDANCGAQRKTQSTAIDPAFQSGDGGAMGCARAIRAGKDWG